MELGTKHDQGKNQLRLLPFEALEKIGEVLTHGANKYGPNNWRKVDNAIPRYQDALLRHLTAYMKGEEIDPESGLPHLAHAGANILFLLSFLSTVKTEIKVKEDIKFFNESIPEFEVGTKFYYDNILLEVVKDERCPGCFFHNKNGSCAHEYFTKCGNQHRKDRLNVKYKEVK